MDKEGIGEESEQGCFTLGTLSKVRRFDQSVGERLELSLKLISRRRGAVGKVDGRQNVLVGCRTSEGAAGGISVRGVICCSAQEYGCIRAMYSNTEEVNGGRLARQASEMRERR